MLFRWMFDHVIGSSVSASSSSRSLDRLSATQIGELDDLIARRSRREPLQYLLGSVIFLGLPLLSRRPVLIPRPETELLTAWTLARITQRDYRKTTKHMNITQEGKYEDIQPWIHTDKTKNKSGSTVEPAAAAAAAKSPLRILDLCSGSGNIALALAHHMPYSCHVVGCDFLPASISLSRDNLSRVAASPDWHRQQQRASRSCQFEQIDLLERPAEIESDGAPTLPPLPGSNPLIDCLLHPPPFVDRLSRLSTPMHRVNLIISNPPYIPIGELPGLQEEVRDWESPAALVSGDDGLEVLEQIVRAAPTLLYSRKAELMSNFGSLAPNPSSSSSSAPPLLDTSDWDIPELVLELGSSSQAMHLATRLTRLGFEHVTIHHDLAGLPRWIAAAREKHVTNK